MLRRFLRDSAVYGLSTIFSRGIGLLMLPFYTRFLTPGDLGAMEILAMSGNIAMIVLTLEITQAVARFFTLSRTESERVTYASVGLWFTICVLVLFALAGTAAAPAIAAHLLGPQFTADLVRAAVLFFAGNGVLYFLLSQLRWELKPWQYAGASVAMTLVSTGVTVVLIALAGFGLEGVYYAGIAGVLVACLVAVPPLRGAFAFTLDPAQLRRMIVFSTPLAASGLALVLASSLDRFVINALTGIDEVGRYAVAARFAGVIALLLAGFQFTVVPLVTSRAREPETPFELARIFRVFLALALPLALLLSGTAYEILLVLTTPEFYGAAPLIPLLTAGTLLAGAYPFAPGLWLSGKTVLALKLNLLLVVFSLAFSVALVSAVGVTGAALASLLTGLCAFALTFGASQRHYRAPHDWRRVGGAIALTVSTVVGFAALYRLAGDSVADAGLVTVRIVAALAVGFALTQILLRPDERRALRRAIASRLQ